MGRRSQSIQRERYGVDSSGWDGSPIIRPEGPAPLEPITVHTLTVGQFNNADKRGFRDPNIGSLLPLTTPLFIISELLLNSGTGKIVLRGVDTGFTKMKVDGVDFLKADAQFDGSDTWRWPSDTSWLVGSTHQIIFAKEIL